MANIMLGCGSANADFTFGGRTNLGPGINSSDNEYGPSISSDGLEFYFSSGRSGGYGGDDLWVCKRPTTDDNWGTPMNLGPTVNSATRDGQPEISADGLSLFFDSYRSGGYGGTDIWVTKRRTKDDPWEEPVNLGPIINTFGSELDVSPSADGLELYFCVSESVWVAKRVTKNDTWQAPVYLTINSPATDCNPHILPDGLTLLFVSDRPGGYGNRDVWITTRQNKEADWAEPVNLGPAFNSQYSEDAPNVSRDGRMLYYNNESGSLPGGFGGNDIWQVPIIPIFDFNGDGIVDAGDMCFMVDHWGEDYSLCDIGPTPLGDGVVDVEDLKVLAEHLFEKVDDPTLIAHWTFDETEGMYATDSVGDNDAVVLGGIEWQPIGGQIEGALKLDGVSGYAITGEVLNPSDGPFSVIAWIKGGAPGQVVLSQTGAANWLCTDSVEGYLMTELKEAGRMGKSLLSQVYITDDFWHRIGFVWDGSKRMLYVDGVVVAQDMQDGLIGSKNGIYIGCGKGMEIGTYFSGLIDDVRIYNRAVSP